jgi:hypothetical protein
MQRRLPLVRVLAGDQYEPQGSTVLVAIAEPFKADNREEATERRFTKTP